ncbi:MAG: hypothetical protein HQ510_05985 [Candidatus Marinimicrobia bacterium]|nr:hypothetical protein [Candidatus Neomarinimicrobiota bacterium]
MTKLFLVIVLLTSPILAQCDWNEDGALNVVDIVGMVDCILNSCWDGSQCDWNEDGNVDVLDIVLTVGCILSDCYINEILDCTDPEACNYNPEADIDDGSCLYFDCNGDCGGGAFENECGCVGGNTGLEYDYCYGCLDPNAMNYNNQITIYNGSCEYCYPGDVNGDWVINVSDYVQLINYILYGGEYNQCFDFNGDGNVDTLDIPGLLHIIDIGLGGSVPTIEFGYTESTLCKIEESPLASLQITLSHENEILITIIAESSSNYFFEDGNSTSILILDTYGNDLFYTDQPFVITSIDAATDIGANQVDLLIDACDFQAPIFGCTDPEALNYNPDANIDDGTCIYESDSLTLSNEYENRIRYLYFVDGENDPVTILAEYYFPDGMPIGIIGQGTSITYLDGYGWFGSIVFELDIDYLFQVAETITYTYPGARLVGCTNPEALNYHPYANLDDGSCEYTEAECIDIDGNVYQTVIIGDQEWMVENLKVTHYRNGDSIPTGYSGSEWSNLSTGAYAVYPWDDDVASLATCGGNCAETYGNLYNWYAVDDSRNITPEGWHVPTDEEWMELTDYLGGYLIAGGKMKSTGTIENGDGLWYAPNAGATNESGFTALPGGYRLGGGTYGHMGNWGYYWSSTESGSFNAWRRTLYYHYSIVSRGSVSKQTGFSVRCVRDAD